MLIIRRLNRIGSASGIVTLKISEWSMSFLPTTESNAYCRKEDGKAAPLPHKLKKKLLCNLLISFKTRKINCRSLKDAHSEVQNNISPLHTLIP